MAVPDEDGIVTDGIQQRSVKAIAAEGPLIEIALATYNGERYLPEQLDSLFAQSWINIRVLANDDGSSDGTLSILTRYADQHPDKLSVDCNPIPLGACGNFASIMERSAANYLAFCDQDDIWSASKLARCMVAMQQAEAQHGNSHPVLIYTDMRLVAGDGSVLSESHWKRAGVRPERARFRNLLAQNLVTGCTMMANRALIDLALPVPAGDAIMHDYWLSLIASAFGTLIPIPELTVDYRQHGSNVVGVGGGLSWVQRLRRFRSDSVLETWLDAAATQASAFLKRFGAVLREEDRSALTAMTVLPRQSWLQRNLTLLRHGIRRTGTLNHLQFLVRL